jgi:DNA polymerase
MTSLHIDFETRSAADLRKVGLYRYAEHPTTSVLMMGYAFGDEQRWLWKPRSTEAIPLRVMAHVSAGGKVTAHNSAFELAIWNTVLRRQVANLPVLHREQCDCTMARALASGLPAALAQLAEVTRSPILKDEAGGKDMLKLSKPKKVHPDGTIEWHEDALLWGNTERYCLDDVGAEKGVDKVVPHLSERERRVWLLDHEINERGVRLDVEMIRRAQAVAELARTDANAEMHRLTEGFVPKVTNNQKIVAWLASRGIETDSIAGDNAEDLSEDIAAVGDDLAQEVMDLRYVAMKASVAKLNKMMDWVCDDGRVRGALAYHGANTGRWAGRGPQFQNMVRIDGDRDLDPVNLTFRILEADLTPQERHDLIEGAVGPVLKSLSKCSRGMVIASEGCRLIGADKSNIEGRVNAWTAGEPWKLDAFRAYDRGEGADLYKVAYAQSFNIDAADVNNAQRQIGKVQELAGGFQGSVGAYLKFIRKSGMKPGAFADLALASATEMQTKDARRQWDQARPKDKHALDERTWIGIKIAVNKWRAAHPAIVQGWWDRQDAAIAAVLNPRQVVPVLEGRIRYLSADGFLWTMLPSTRLLAYALPWVDWQSTPKWLYTTTDPDTRERVLADDFGTDEVALYDEDGKLVKAEERYERRRRVVKHWINQKGWRPRALYGGLQCENDTQAIARDTMVEDMFAARDAGYPIVLTVHDELVTDVPFGHGSADELAQIMSRVPDWIPGLPLAAKAWEDRRYVK